MNSDSTTSGRPMPPPLTVEEQAVRTAQWIHECDQLREMRASVEEGFPDLPVAEVDLFIATLVIGNNLGEDWVETNIEAPGAQTNGQRPKTTKTSVYLRRSPGDRRARLEHYVRVMELARRIFELGQEPFAESLKENLRRRDLEGAAFEADVVRMLISLPTVINLRDERKVKGDDYDIDLWLKPGIPWAIEVKTRAEDSPYTSARLQKTLSNARKQLPPDGLGGIFLKVPTPWTEDADYREGHHADVTNFLANTSRIQAVVLVWDVWNDDGASWSWSRSQRIFKSTQIEPYLDELLTHYQRIWDGPHDLIGPNAPF
ncbi:hypothetical protein LRL17_31050 (plasmid) [Rhodococcus qingshengii]|uniref:hypothetical protein n=1 Tax=Rhodococcus qingshengii TaxID=334542 RepID=UPI001E4CC22D|nr:hypothetical protein [Rhodococcus qingshengii]UGQ55392.1 hypothetical protein LRL17_31050 [Rhodococcus qingshengii]